MSQNHKGNVQPSIDNEEHEHYLQPATKRVLAYGYDGSAKQILKVDSNGNLNVVSPLPTSGTNGSLSITYDASNNPTTIEKTIGGVTYTKTLTWTDGVCTAVSAWS